MHPMRGYRTGWVCETIQTSPGPARTPAASLVRPVRLAIHALEVRCDHCREELASEEKGAMPAFSQTTGTSLKHLTIN